MTDFTPAPPFLIWTQQGHHNPASIDPHCDNQGLAKFCTQSAFQPHFNQLQTGNIGPDTPIYTALVRNVRTVSVPSMHTYVFLHFIAK